MPFTSPIQVKKVLKEFNDCAKVNNTIEYCKVKKRGIYYCYKLYRGGDREPFTTVSSLNKIIDVVLLIAKWEDMEVCDPRKN